MAVFPTSTVATDVFASLFEILLEDGDFRSKLAGANLSLHLIQKNPDVELYVSADGVVRGAPTGPVAIKMKMSCDTAHALWMGDLLMPLAVATGRVRIRGNVAKVLEMVPILQPAFDRYPDIVAARGIAAA